MPARRCERMESRDLLRQARPRGPVQRSPRRRTRPATWEEVMKRLGVDVGGTFTDLIYVDDEGGKILVHKLPTTPRRPLTGDDRRHQRSSPSRRGRPRPTLDQVFHGTTIATNIVIEHNGAKVGMLTTEGYRDILHIARHKKPLNFSNYQDLPWQRLSARAAPLPAHRPRAHHGRRRGARPARRGRRPASRCASSRRPASRPIAVCFLFSFLKPDHEQRVGGDRPRGVPRGVPLGLLGGPARSTASTSASRPSRSTPTSARRWRPTCAAWRRSCARSTSARACTS